MGILSSCCQKPKDFPADDRTALRNGGRVRVRNEIEDPHAPLLTKKISNDRIQDPQIQEIDDMIDNLSDDLDDEIPIANDDELDEILDEKRD